MQDVYKRQVATVGQEAYDKIFKVLADKSFSSFVLTSKEKAVVNIVKKETFEIPSLLAMSV